MKTDLEFHPTGGGRFRLPLIFSGVLALTVATAPAQSLTYEVDTTQSSLTLSGAVRYYFNGSVFGFGGQTAGSLTTAYGGTLNLVANGGGYTFGAGSTLNALENPDAPFLPAGPGMDAYGMLTASRSGLANNRMWDISLDLSGGDVEDGTPYTGFLAYAPGSSGIFPFFDANPIDLSLGQSANNVSANPFTLATNGNIETLTLPVNANLIYFSSNGQAGVETRLIGTIVATRVIPEPATGAFVLLSTAALMRRRRDHFF